MQSVGPETSKGRGMLLSLVCVAQFINVLSVTVVIVALPEIQRDLRFSESSLQWVVSIYALFFGGFLMLSGRAADLYGRRRLFLLGLGLFSVAALACALSTTSTVLIAARAIQGMGAAVAVPSALSLLTTSFTDARARERALGVWTAAAAGGGATGFFLGGLVTGSVGWRWVFVLNVPIGLAGIVVGLALLAPDGGERVDTSLDLAGALTVTGGLAALILGFTRAQVEGFDALNSFLVGGGVALLVAFGVIERTASDPLIPPQAYRSRRVVGANLVAFSVTAVTSPASVIGSLYLRRILDFSAASTGLIFAPFSIAVIVGSFAGARFTSRLGPRPTIAAGLVVIGAAMVVTSLIDVGGGAPFLLTGMALSGLGLGCASVPATAVGTAAVEEAEQGVASGLLNTAAQVGTAVGIGALVTLAAARTSALAGSSPASPAQLLSGYRSALLTGAALAGAALIGALVLIRARQGRPIS